MPSSTPPLQHSNTPPLTRRDLFRNAGRRLVFKPEVGPKGDVLITIFLRGAMDGVHTVPPYADPGYRRGRPTLALAEPGKPGGIVDLDGHFGLHPDLSPLSALYRGGHLAVVHACGSPDSTLSHFEAMQTMERGVSDGNSTATGWITRHLASTHAEGSSPLRAIAFGDVLPKSLQGSLTASAVRSLTEFRLPEPKEWSAFRATLAGMYAGGSDAASTAGRETLELLRSLEKLDPATYKPESGAKYPDNGLGNSLKQVAQLIKAEVGLEVAALDLGGWDSHVAQVTLMTGLMKELAGSLAALHADLGDRMRRVTVVAMTEFGRRVHENSGLGTDHGRGSALFVLGGAVRGGKVYGRWPGLLPGQLDRDGNLRVTTDYRDVLCEVVRKRLRNPEVRNVFPDYTPASLELLQA
jgi:uncharacterized protein (DUF1501 family)